MIYVINDFYTFLNSWYYKPGGVTVKFTIVTWMEIPGK
jgi:hypothetical protein